MLGLLSFFSSAISFNDFFSGALFGLSFSVGCVLEVSALSLTGSPSWLGFVSFLRSLRGFLSLLFWMVRRSVSVRSGGVLVGDGAY